MIIIISLIILVIGLILFGLSQKYYIKLDRLEMPGIVLGVIGGISTAACILLLAMMYLNAPAQKAKVESLYESYNVQLEITKERDGVITESEHRLFLEIAKWNADLKQYKEYSSDPFIGIFFPKSVIEDIKTIPLKPDRR